jgi:ketosteroid isomerase-like protein
MSQFAMDEIVRRLELRSAGAWDALDGVWAPKVSRRRMSDPSGTEQSDSERARGTRAILEALAQAMPDFTRRSVFHVAEATNTIFELSTWSGTFRGNPVLTEACIVYTVENGRISAMNAYMDTVQNAALQSVLTASGFVLEDRGWLSKAE